MPLSQEVKPLSKFELKAEIAKLLIKQKIYLGICALFLIIGVVTLIITSSPYSLFLLIPCIIFLVMGLEAESQAMDLDLLLTVVEINEIFAVLLTQINSNDD